MLNRKAAGDAPVLVMQLLLAAFAAQFFMLRDITPSQPEYPYRVAAEAAVLGIFVAALFLDVMTFKYIWLAFMFIALLRPSCCDRHV